MLTRVFVTELVNAFNLNNYFSDNINTNISVQEKKGKGDKIVSFFSGDVDVKKYLKEVREEIIRRHFGTEAVAGEFYNLSCFPFSVSSNKGKKLNGEKVVELAALMHNEVIRNLKLHFAMEFQQAVEARVAGNLVRKTGMTREEACKCVKESILLEKTDRSTPYLYCISFSDKYFRGKGYPHPSRFLELLRSMYIVAFDSRLEKCGFSDSSVFYKYHKDNKLHIHELYIKDVTNINIIKDIVKCVKREISLDFKTSGKEDSKVENFKDAINDLIFKVTGKFIEGYEYDVFTNEDEIKKGHSFALIPLVEINDQLGPLSEGDAYKVNQNFYKILADIILSDIKGKTKDGLGQISGSEGQVYAFSNEQIALLLSEIMKSPIAHNRESKRFEFAVELENLRSRQRPLSPIKSPLISPTNGPRLPNGDVYYQDESRLSDDNPNFDAGVPGSSGRFQENPGAFDREGSNRSNSSTGSGGKRKRAVMSGDWSDQELIIDAFVRGAPERKSGESGYHTNGTTSKAGSESPWHSKPLSEMGATEAEQPFSRGIGLRSSGCYADRITQQRQKDKDVKVMSHS
ncbi:MAG: hypothetical protein ACR5K9_04235 [Wolbachia sp.]